MGEIVDSLYAAHAYLPEGWVSDVRFNWNKHGTLIDIQTGVAALPHETINQFVLPGMINLHSHAFQRSLAGMTEIAGEGPDSFWTWRDLMYRYALQINPQQMQAIAAQLYSECLRHGYTSVCEFHYLHRAPDGAFYDNPAETAQGLIAAAELSGIGISMLPVLYSYADFNALPLRTDQRRFNTSVDDILTIIQRLEASRNELVEVGVAPHSLRAASIEQIQQLVAGLPKQRPIHIHIAEQQREVEACLAATGKRPVELLLDSTLLDARWCLVHATHLNPSELQGIAASGAVAGICPSTEANLGDGFFDLPEYINLGGRFGIGSDSHVSQSPVEELRWLEYGQRLRHQKRNVASVPGQRHIADFLWKASLSGGAQASGRQVGSLKIGARADMLVLDHQSPNLHGLDSRDVLNTWIFAGNDNLVRDVYVGGKQVVQHGRHRHQEQIEQEFRNCMQQLRQL